MVAVKALGPRGANSWVQPLKESETESWWGFCAQSWNAFSWVTLAVFADGIHNISRDLKLHSLLAWMLEWFDLHWSCWAASAQHFQSCLPFSSSELGLGALGTFPGICYLCQRPRCCHCLINRNKHVADGPVPLQGWAPPWLPCTPCSPREKFFCHSLHFKIVFSVWFYL